MAMATGRLRRIQDALTPQEWARTGAMGAVVVGLWVTGFALLLAATPHHYRISKGEVFGVGTGILALTLGMRHAFDADHISAIDNTTRKLMADGKRPLSVGFFFSLGHSTVVFVLSVLLNLGIRSLDKQVRSAVVGAAQRHHHRRDVGVGDVSVPDRRAQPRDPGVDRPRLHGPAPGPLRRR